MAYRLETLDDAFLDETYNTAISELNEFFKFNWHTNKPKLIMIKDRKTYDIASGRKTDDWNIGFAEGNCVYIMDRHNLEKESCHKYNDESYKATIKHELAHLYYHKLSGGKRNCKWFNEGIAIYASGQNRFKKKPERLETFLEFYDDVISKGVYSESGFAIEHLIEKHGKDKLLNFIKAQKEINSKDEFYIKFKEIYGFDLDYSNFNI